MSERNLDDYDSQDWETLQEEFRAEPVEVEMVVIEEEIDLHPSIMELEYAGYND